MNLTDHFTIEELTASETAARHGIDNSAPIALDANLRHLAGGLEAVRVILDNQPIHVNSGYRCPDLNKLVGGQPHSAHLMGLAADFICPSFGTPREICQAVLRSELNYEQVILEFDSWCHVAFATLGRISKREALIINRDGVSVWV